MKVGKTGDWALARRILGNAPAKLRAAVDAGLRQEAQLLRKEIVQGITRQAPGGEALDPPSELTLAARQMKGFGGTKALMVRGDLRNSITAIVKNGTAFIGVPRKARGKDGAPLVDVAEAQEFGTEPAVVPMTEKSRRFFFAMLRNAGIEPQPGTGSGVFVIQVPPRPFLRPAFKAWRKGAQQRFLRRIAARLGFGA